MQGEGRCLGRWQGPGGQPGVCGCQPISVASRRTAEHDREAPGGEELCGAAPRTPLRKCSAHEVTVKQAHVHTCHTALKMP